MSSPTLSLAEEDRNGRKELTTGRHRHHLGLLPAEILNLILSFVSHPDLVLRVSLVDKHLREACLESPSLWSTVMVKKDWPLELARGMIDYAAQSLRELVVMERSEDQNNELAIRALRDCPRLEKLTYHPNLYQKISTTFLETVGRCQGLKQLVLSGFWVEFHRPALVSKAGNLSRLTRLHFGGFGIGGDELRAVADNCGQHLESFQLRLVVETAATGEVFVHFLNKVHGTMKDLQVHFVYVPGKDIFSRVRLTGELFERLGTCRRLEKLHLNGFWSIGVSGLRSLTELPMLTELSLTNCTRTLGKQLAFVLDGRQRSLDKLIKLDLSRTDVDDTCLEAISKSCPNLEQIDLSGCWSVKDREVRSLLARCKRMRCLDLNYLGSSLKAFDGFPMKLTIECGQYGRYETKEWDPPYYCGCALVSKFAYCRVRKAVKNKW